MNMFLPQICLQETQSDADDPFHQVKEGGDSLPMEVEVQPARNDPVTESPR